MTTNNELPENVYIRTEETPERPPPLLEVGALAWIKNNLLGSPLDVILTVSGFLLIIAVIVSLASWTVGAGNWNVITVNFRQFMLGTFEREYEWRIMLFGIYLSITIGTAIAAWTRRIGPATIIGLIIVFAPIFVLPTLIKSTIQLPSTYLAAGNIPIVSGTESNLPQNDVAFLGQENEEVAFRFASIATNDEDLAELSGFADVASNTLRNSALNRRDDITDAQNILTALEQDVALIETGDALGGLTQGQRESYVADLAKSKITPTEEQAARITEINEQLVADIEAAEAPNGEAILSAEERTALEDELLILEFGPTSSEFFNLNQEAVTFTILDGETLEPIADSQTLESADSEVQFTLPKTGWYILQKTLADQDASGVTLLEVDNVSPIFQGGLVFRRITDGFEVPRELEIPRMDGSPVDFLVIIQNQYRGERTASAYFRVYVVPFLETIDYGVALMLVAATLAYLVAQYLSKNILAGGEAGRFALVDIAGFMIIATPVLLYVFVNGIGEYLFGLIDISFLGLGFSDPLRWGGLLLAGMVTTFGIIIAFPLGILLALGRRSSLPAVKYISTLYIELIRGTPFIVVLFTMQVLIPFVHPSLANIPNAWRAIIATIFFSAAYLAENVRGGLQSLPPGQEEAGKAVGLSGWQVTVFITMPQALRAVIPALVGQFIGLFKDTSLLAIVGLIDMLRTVYVVDAQTEFKGTRFESIVFISIIYFVLSYVMSTISRRIEETGSGATRRV
jgi:His/Glu/Gln/Arg/opine family amino acid ABC transporter permease subunit